MPIPVDRIYHMSFLASFRISSIVPVPSIVGIITVVLVCTALASEGSLPGGILYPVKIGINEELRAFFTFGASADAHWNVRRSERRLEEAEKLASHDSVSVSTYTKLTADFKTLSNHAQRNIEDLHTAGNNVAAQQRTGELAAVLKGHESALIKIEGYDSTPHEVVKALREEVQKELQETNEVKVLLDVEIQRFRGEVVSTPMPGRKTSPKPVMRLDGPMVEGSAHLR